MRKSVTIITLLCLALSTADANAAEWFFKKKKKTKEKETIEEVQQEINAEDDKAKQFVITNPGKQFSGEWTIKKLKNKKISTEERAFLNFNTETGLLYGNNGCNVINGEFKLEGRHISFNNILTTSRECAYSSSSKNIMKALADVHELNIVEENGIEYLILLNKHSNELLYLKRHNFDFANGAWTVTEIDGELTNSNDVKIVIDTDQLKLHGNTGCNIINGEITIDSNKHHAIQFENITSTRKMCPNINRETALLVALEETVSIKLIDDNHINLIDNKGTAVVALKRLNLSQD